MYRFSKKKLRQKSFRFEKFKKKANLIFRFVTHSFKSSITFYLVENTLTNLSQTADLSIIPAYFTD